MVSALGATDDHRGDRQERPLRAAARCRPGRICCARTSPVSSRPRGRSSTSARARSAIVVDRAAARSRRRTPILAAGIGCRVAVGRAADAPAVAPAAAAGRAPRPRRIAGDDHGEIAWRLRHARRSVLKDVTVPAELLADGDDAIDRGRQLRAGRRSSAGPSDRPLTLATNFFAGRRVLRPGQSADDRIVRLAAAAVLDRQLSRSIAYLRARRAGRPDGRLDGARRARRRATSRRGSSPARTRRVAPARHRYDIGLSYSTQRYDGGNVLALRDVTDGSRNAGTVYGFDTFTITPMLTRRPTAAATRRYDYLRGSQPAQPARGAHARRRPITSASARRRRAARSRLAPRSSCRLATPASGCRRSGRSRRSTRAPASTPSGPLTSTSRSNATSASSTVSLRAFRQHVDDQLVTLFGAEIPGQPAAKLGHYFVGNIGDVDATRLRAGAADRDRQSLPRLGRVLDVARRNRRRDGIGYLVAGRPVRAPDRCSERIHDVATSLETEVPETSTRVLVLYRVEQRVRAPGRIPDAALPALDRRFDVQVRQSLPFMNFSSAKWEMLLAVRNFFRDIGVRSVVLRRAARRPSAQADRRRPDAAVLGSPSLGFCLAIHNFWNTARKFGTAWCFSGSCLRKALYLQGFACDHRVAAS